MSFNNGLANTLVVHSRRVPTIARSPLQLRALPSWFYHWAQAGGPLGRDHFASFAPAGALLRLLDCTAVPCRTAHIGAVVLSAVVRPGAGADAFFAAAAAAAAAAGGQGGSGGQGGGHRGPGARRGEAHGPQLFVGGGPDLVLEMLRWLAPLTALESQEREMRRVLDTQWPPENYYLPSSIC